MAKIKPSSCNAWQSRCLQTFDDVDYSQDQNAVVDTTKNLPYTWIDVQPITTSTNQFERNDVPYRYDTDGVYMGDYRMGVQPIIVEKEVIREIYLTPTTPFSAAIDMYKRMKGEVVEGKRIYRDDSGRIVSR